MPEKFNANSFGTFLETINQADTTRSFSKGLAMSSGARSALGPLTILQKLAASPNQRMDVPSLLSASDLPLDAFASAMREFAAAGLLATDNHEGREIASLTSVGEQVARVKL